MADQAPSLEGYLAQQPAAPATTGTPAPSLEGYLESQNPTPKDAEYKAPDTGVLGAYEKALNRDASTVIPGVGLLGGLAQGFMKTADKAVLGTADIINQHFNWGAGEPPIPVPSEATRRALTENNRPGQGTGGFLGDAAMFAIPAGVAGEVLAGAPLAARLLAQAAIGGGVAAAQNSGDPMSTATGTIMGATGEASAPLIKFVGDAAKDIQPTLANFSKSFGATPLQKGIVSETLPTLVKEGVKPAGSVPEMAAEIAKRLAGAKVPPKAPTLENFARSFGGATPQQQGVISDALATLIKDKVIPADDAVAMAKEVQARLAKLPEPPRATTVANYARSFGATPAQTAVVSDAAPDLIKAGMAPQDSLPKMAQAVERALSNTPVPTRSLTLNNYSRSFGASQGENAAITKAMPTLARDGITPASSAPEMHEVITKKLEDLGGQYRAIPADIADRTISANDVIKDLRNQQKKFIGGVEHVSKEVPSGLVDEYGNPSMTTKTTARPLITNANQGYYNQIEREIEDVQKFASTSKDGTITFKNLQHLRDGANGRTNWQSLPADRNLYDDVGNVYRSNMNKLAPETTQLNRDYATYKQLESISKKSVDTGRGAANPDIWEGHGNTPFARLSAARDVLEKNLAQNKEVSSGLWEGQEGTPYARYKSLNDILQKNLSEGRVSNESGIWHGQENTPYAHYHALNDVIQKNLNEGKGTTKSGLDVLLHKAEGAGYGLTVGSEIGHHVAGIPGSLIGGAVGMYAVPKLAEPIVQALRNISESSALGNAAPGARRALQAAIQTGKSDVIKRAIQGISRATITGAIAGPAHEQRTQ